MSPTPAVPGGLPFALSEYQARLAKVRRAMDQRSLDLLLVTGPENICYLTGYATTGYHVFQALLVPLTGRPSFVVRRLELGNVEHGSCVEQAVPVDDGADPIAITASAVRDLGARSVGYEDQGFFLTAAAVEGLRAALAPARLAPASGLVESARRIKSPAEIALIEAACGIAEAGLETGIAAVTPGRSENRVVAALYGGLLEAGSEYTGSPPFVAAGRRSAIRHATFAMAEIGATDNLWFEVPASRHRYHAGIGRTVAVGPEPERLRRLSDLVLSAIEAMIQAIRPGVTSGEVDAAGRSLVAQAGLGELWPHRGGYSLGVSFPPGLGEGHIMDIKPGDPRPLEAGMVFHLVPILFAPDLGAVGCTETVAVTPGGHETFATLPRRLIRAPER